MYKQGKGKFTAHCARALAVSKAFDFCAREAFETNSLNDEAGLKRVLPIMQDVC